MMKKLSVFYLLMTTMAMSCAERTANDTDGTDDTSCEDVMCTFQFETITVKVVDGDGAPVTLDSIKVTRVSDKQDLTAGSTGIEGTFMHEPGVYMLADDGYDADAIPRFEETELHFEGFIGDSRVVSGDYMVTYDCCHISLVSGERELIVR
ncbi:hypothetical protein ACFOET_17145 [Parapedobacter deserti]|uniref:Carboxypeptidase regulatory-like domain-containing protein n=1 Tax=Parapedobacter deserti TaxID=1912957 RepID=A0ABV7JQA1_9SPHI